MKELAINGGEPTSLKVLGYGHQDINEDDIKAVEDCLRGDYLTCGPAPKPSKSLLRLPQGLNL